MKSLMNNFRSALVTLATTGMLIPVSVWAKGPGGGSVPYTHKPATSTNTSATSGRSGNPGASTGSMPRQVTPAQTGNPGYTGVGLSPKPRHQPADVTKIFGNSSDLGSSLAGPVYPSSIVTAADQSLYTPPTSKNVMDFFGDLGNDVTAAANAVGQAASDAVNAVIGAGDDAGNAAADAAGAIASAAAIVVATPAVVGAAVLGVAVGGAAAAAVAVADAIVIGTIAGVEGNPNKAADPNNLTNGAGSRYKDGATPSNYPPSGSLTTAPAAKKLNFGSASLSSKTSAATIVADGELKKYGSTIPVQNMIGKSQAAQQPKPPTQTTPSPSNPTPMPRPSGSVFGGGSSGGSTDSTTDSATTADAIAGPATIAAATGIDLVLEDVKLASPATLVAGPAYTVTFRNQGTKAAGKFEVAILAGLAGKVTADAPRAIVEVESLGAGQVKEVTLRLPQKALKLADADHKLVLFTHLFVAVDLLNTVAETDETNNTAVIERVALETVYAD